ncbi:serine hydrolase [Pseudonocardia sp. TRM90224]|uniref:serine hydrolase n=1 Tax=Pseudonocardia sp. TRM90224 TaxID=2812678 RepID=UPI001E3DAE58|nr:serine hydrolase [Pseudonocardia sp. TRM90224]
MSPAEEVRAAFAEAGVRGWLHAVAIGGSREVDVDADEPVVMASVYKLPLLVAFVRLVDEGGIDPTEPVELPVAGRTPGPTGLSVLRDPVTLSWRDLAALTITVSDNAAADVLLRRVGLERVNALLAELGLTGTRVVGGTEDILRDLRGQVGAPDVRAAFAALARDDAVPDVAAYDPALTSATTARDMTALLAGVWQDTVASPAGCAFARELLGAQVWPHRLRAGFPYREATVAGKTGTIGAIRNEVGVVSFAGERPVAVAVFTRAARADPVLPRADAVIGTAARLAVTPLRSGRL